MPTNHYTTREIFNPRDGFAFETITVGASAIPLTSSVYLDAIQSYMSLEDNALRVNIDGSTPTSGNGHLVNASDVIKLYNPHQIQNFRAIRNGIDDAILQVTYYH